MADSPRDQSDDEDALTWAGDSDLGKVSPALRRAVQYEMRDSAQTADDPTGPRPSALTTLVTVLFGAVYLVFTIGWILAVQRTDAGTTDLVPQILWQFGEFTAIVAAPLWFGATVTLTAATLTSATPARVKRTLARVGWLALGAGLLIPWPLILFVIGNGGFS
jgi:hypothetical protein